MFLVFNIISNKLYLFVFFHKHLSEWNRHAIQPPPKPCDGALRQHWFQLFLWRFKNYCYDYHNSHTSIAVAL